MPRFASSRRLPADSLYGVQLLTALEPDTRPRRVERRGDQSWALSQLPTLGHRFWLAERPTTIPT